MNHDEKFERIKNYFEKKDKELAHKGKLPLGSTQKGFWGTTHLDDFYEFCKRIHLDKNKSFIDLGSGDGRCVFVAALFTNATGIEFDKKLDEEARAAALDLKSEVSFLCDDYTKLDLSRYDVWFSYADHNFEWLAQKRHELTDLYLYHDTFHPSGFVKEKTIWIGQVPIYHYRPTAS